VNSGRLDALAPADASAQGWTMSSCPPDAPKCLVALSGGLLAAPADGPSGPRSAGGLSFDGGAAYPVTDVSTGVSWLADVAQTPAAPQGGAGATADAGAAKPAGFVSQTVSLDPGSYVLSWWDQARDPKTGAPPTAGASLPKYVVRIYDAAWAPVASFSSFPYIAAQTGGGVAPSSWSDRRVLGFTVASSAVYHVAFSASVPGAVLGGVAIADVQLEKALAGGQPSTYVETGASTLITAYDCPRSQADLRTAFVRNCDGSGACSYDLSLPMIIDTLGLNTGDSALRGKLAQGNFNFRHTTLAVNLVGTGVHDCSSDLTQECYGTGYVEYSLEHDATTASILDYDGNPRMFDFGTASVEHGKALAAERFLTMPLSSGDQALVSQPGIQHIEFQGRPLDGTYRLRIWDSPALHWGKLQDIQIILTYRYWSQIVGTGAGAH
jgi:hypothetical protein